MGTAEPTRKIVALSDVTLWKQSTGYSDYLNFVKQLNEFAKNVHQKSPISSADNCRESIDNAILLRVVDLLDNLVSLVDQIKPFEDDKNQRFGNKAYRVWFEQMKVEVDKFVENGSSNAIELRAYLVESFGNQQRIDYGTGHEMCFVIFLMGVYKLELLHTYSATFPPPKEEIKKLSQQLLTIFAWIYLPLVRKVQLVYRLEPAGSHGAFSLDDFQFLPFYFGSAQLIGHPEIEPQTFPEAAVAEKYKDEYIFHAAIHFIHQVKKGPFFEHSNRLWDISAVEDWAKINKGLLNMYIQEFLPKFPIVQHLVFGEKVLIWQPKK